MRPALDAAKPSESETSRDLASLDRGWRRNWILQSIRRPAWKEMRSSRSGMAPAWYRGFASAVALMPKIMAYALSKTILAAFRRPDGAPQNLQQHCPSQLRPGRTLIEPLASLNGLSLPMLKSERVERSRDPRTGSASHDSRKPPAGVELEGCAPRAMI